ncbi:MAG: hypothetical protein HYV07_33935 [Deltaproteobacteria bacterium]|nr:hypothetical protein [Deltaproteobacteria bacterium]
MPVGIDDSHDQAKPECGSGWRHRVELERRALLDPIERRRAGVSLTQPPCCSRCQRDGLGEWHVTYERADDAGLVSLAEDPRELLSGTIDGRLLRGRRPDERSSEESLTTTSRRSSRSRLALLIGSCCGFLGRSRAAINILSRALP